MIFTLKNTKYRLEKWKNSWDISCSWIEKFNSYFFPNWSYRFNETLIKIQKLFFFKWEDGNKIYYIKLKYLE